MSSSSSRTYLLLKSMGRQFNQLEPCEDYISATEHYISLSVFLSVPRARVLALFLL